MKLFIRCGKCWKPICFPDIWAHVTELEAIIFFLFFMIWNVWKQVNKKIKLQSPSELLLGMLLNFEDTLSHVLMGHQLTSIIRSAICIQRTASIDLGCSCVSFFLLFFFPQPLKSDLSTKKRIMHNCRPPHEVLSKSV